MSALIGYYVLIAALLLLLRVVDHVRDSDKRAYRSEGAAFKSTPVTSRLHSHPVNGD